MKLPIFLHASQHNGVYEVSAIDFYQDGLAPLKPEWFLENLNTVKEDEVILTVIHGEDLEVYEKIKAEYGIN